jgi:hypothetical protein
MEDGRSGTRSGIKPRHFAGHGGCTLGELTVAAFEGGRAVAGDGGHSSFAFLGRRSQALNPSTTNPSNGSRNWVERGWGGGERGEEVCLPGTLERRRSVPVAKSTRSTRGIKQPEHAREGEILGGGVRRDWRRMSW